MAELVHFCVLADRSGSMVDGDAIGQLNRTLDGVMTALAEDPLIAYHVRVAVVSFGTDARWERDFTAPVANGPRHALEAGGYTNLAAALDLAADRVAVAVHDCLAAGGRPKAPVLFVLTDGRPTNPPGHRTWQEALTAIPGRFRPELVPAILAFGMGDADRTVLRAIAGSRIGLGAYVVDEGVDAASAIKRFGEVFLHTVLATTLRGVPTKPPAVAGVVALTPLELDDLP